MLKYVKIIKKLAVLSIHYLFFLLYLIVSLYNLLLTMAVFNNWLANLAAFGPGESV